MAAAAAATQSPMETSPERQVSLKLIQEVKTRFDSCFEMVDRYLLISPSVTSVLYEMKREGSSKAKVPDIITPDEEKELTELRAVLAPLSRFNKELSYEKITTLSKCIPLVGSLRHEAEKFQPETELGKVMKRDLLALLNEKFGMIEEVQLFARATLLDWRFKRYAFYRDLRTPRRVAKAIDGLSELVKENMKVAQQQTESNFNQPAACEDNDFWGSLDRELAEQSARLAGQDVAGGLPVQLRQYLDSPLVPRATTPNPLEPWEAVKGEYKFLYPLAQEYLGILATSIPSERLFSHAGQISSDLRSRLSGKKLDMLVFLRSCEKSLWFS